MMVSQIASRTIVYSTVYSDADQRKYISSALLAFAWEIHRGPVNSPRKWPVTRKMFPFDDVIVYNSGVCLRLSQVIGLIKHHKVFMFYMSVRMIWWNTLGANLNKPRKSRNNVHNPPGASNTVYLPGTDMTSGIRHDCSTKYGKFIALQYYTHVRNYICLFEIFISVCRWGTLELGC